MDAAEVEFLAEKELVTIIPNFSLDKIYLIGGDLGPFNPGLPVEVPLWLAINLKQRQKCRLIPPEWMDVEKLEKIRDHERKEETFTPMPSPYYMELTKLLLNQFYSTANHKRLSARGDHFRLPSVPGDGRRWPLLSSSMLPSPSKCLRQHPQSR
ncbi:DNA replication complex GINS protein PSF2 isoform X2 [Hyaena hyaena]|uniref:DNA replication complex GINS protein PSF2 isoform X2 n=1 Tax=Hyaena hyaena TaxID=95912 RepID=UPI0019234883|nr:DNA replication complex GINS protein PSF2 isoform X2 [Hyaena hyaena]